MYDTTKSKFIEGHTVKYAARPQDDIQENLYRTSSGKYFAATIYGDRRTESITPLTAAEARLWVEQHRGTERAAQLFPKPKQSTDGINITLSIPPETAAKIAATVASTLAPSDITPLLRGLRELVSHSV